MLCESERTKRPEGDKLSSQARYDHFDTLPYSHLQASGDGERNRRAPDAVRGVTLCHAVFRKPARYYLSYVPEGKMSSVFCEKEGGGPAKLREGIERKREVFYTKEQETGRPLFRKGRPMRSRRHHMAAKRTKRDRKAVPIVKWVGGKRQLLSALDPLLPKRIRTYCEPFVGGGAMLFHLQPDSAYVNDVNPELINLYEVIRDDVDSLLAELETFRNEPDFFYAVRDWDRDPQAYAALSRVKRAARVIYLNKTCYNGLFRVNSAGEFNTPFGRYKNPSIVNESARSARLCTAISPPRISAFPAPITPRCSNRCHRTRSCIWTRPTTPCPIRQISPATPRRASAGRSRSACANAAMRLTGGKSASCCQIRPHRSFWNSTGTIM